MKKRNILILTFIAAIAALLSLVIGGRYYYLENEKYAALETELIKIHRQMEADFPKELIEKPEHFGAGISIRNTYGLWGSEQTPLKQELQKAGVTHPDDMSSIIMETYIRAKKGVPFKLHRLIKLQQAVDESKNKQEPLKKLADEYYIYEQYRKVQR